MGFGIEKYIMHIQKSGQREKAEGIELTNQKNYGTFREKENYKCFGILKPDTIKQVEMKEKTKKRVPQKNQKASQTKLYSRNLIKRTNTREMTIDCTCQGKKRESPC